MHILFSLGIFILAANAEAEVKPFQPDSSGPKLTGTKLNQDDLKLWRFHSPGYDKSAPTTWQWSEGVQLGFNFTSGINSSLALTSLGQVLARKEQFQTRLNGTAAYTRTKTTQNPGTPAAQSTVTDRSQYQLESRSNYYFSKKIYGFLGTAYLRDTSIGFRHEGRVYGGPGLVLLENADIVLSTETGYSFSREWRNAPSVTRNLQAAKLGLTFTWLINSGWFFNFLADGLVNLKHSDDGRAEISASLTGQIYRGFALSLTYGLRYSHLPAAGFDRSVHTTAVVVSKTF